MLTKNLSNRFCKMSLGKRTKSFVNISSTMFVLITYILNKK